MQISDDNFLDYCQLYYTNQHCHSIDEFLEDLKIIKYIKVLLRKHIMQKDINEQLLINHFISFYNVFDHEKASQIIFFRLEDYYWPAARAVFDYLGKTPNNFISSDHKRIYTEDIVSCEQLKQKLNKLNPQKTVCLTKNLGSTLILPL